MVKWTEAQEAAIYSKGSDILVAAAAGSGKTAVLVERMIQKLLDTEDPVNIDELLVVTFTNAAAQEMRNRIGAAIEQALEKNPQSNHLKKQLSLLQRAPISTLHSFCLDVVRQYAYLLDIDPSFRIADEMEADLIKQDVIDDLFETWYGAEGPEQELFFAVIDRFSGDRSDQEVEDLLLDLYTFAMQNPWPEQWLDALSAPYNADAAHNDNGMKWLDVLKHEVRQQLEAIEQEIAVAEQIAREPDGPYLYIETIEAEKSALQTAKSHVEDWNALQAFMSDFKFGKLSGKKSECDADKKENVKKIRDAYKKRWNKIKDAWFVRSLDKHLSAMQELAPVVQQLAEMVKQFIKQYEAEKKERALVDFTDLEHYCLRILTNADADTDIIEPSEAALSFKDKFKEVLIDEYQDVNLVQETIVSLISDQEGPGNRFMVGDVKQSIYRFRHAEPGLFLGKYKAFAKPGSVGKCIDLASNFRSRREVLIGANYIFRQILDETLGEMAYDKAAELIYANKMYEVQPYAEPEPELVILDREKTSESTEPADTQEELLEDLEKAQLEARLYAQRIKQWIGEGTDKPLQVTDKGNGTQRDIQYRDIVILLRSMTWAPLIAEELKKQGIPVYAEISTGYFAAMEIKMMISLLKVIDNPRQDIPLAAVLKSPIVGLNEEELARIRLADRKHALYDAVHAYYRESADDTRKKLHYFLEKLEAFRQSARQGALADLIWQIYRETGFYDFAGGMPGGRQRQANLRALYDRARSYERTSFRGLFRFLRFIERMEERGDDLGTARALSEQEDVVRIMTIHKSKGLEFPVVILGAMDKQFNMQDLIRKYSLHKDFGFATKFIDPVKRVVYPTLFYQAVNEAKKREMLAEEMRVLYVALTRAKEKLLMVGNVGSFAKKQKRWEQMLEQADWVLPAHFRAAANSYLDWVGPALIRHQDSNPLRNEDIAVPDAVLNEIKADPSRWKVSIVSVEDLAITAPEAEVEETSLSSHLRDWQPIPREDQEAADWVDKRLSYRYPHMDAAVTRAKQSVTEIKRQREVRDDYASDQLIRPFRAPIVQRPRFMQAKKQLSAAEKGTALHTMMQHLPLNRPLNEIEIEAFTETLVEKEIMDRAAADSIDFTAIAAFYQTPIAATLMEAATVQREIPFSLSLPAGEVYANWQSDTEERVFIQGIIDCAFPLEDGWVILDYKTDDIGEGEVTEALKASLLKRYETQLQLYRRAIEEIWNVPVKGTYLYFFHKHLLIKAP